MFNKKNKLIVKIEGMKCKHCAKKVEDSLNNLEGVNKVKVNLHSNEAIIISDNVIDKNLIIDTIENLDYKVIEML